MNDAMHKLSRLGLLCGLLIPLCAAAESQPKPEPGAEAQAAATEQPAASQPATESVTTGSAAEWLEIQREGKMPGNLLPIPGDEARASYQRYLNSFNSGSQRQSAPVSSSSSGTAK